MGINEPIPGDSIEPREVKVMLVEDNPEHILFTRKILKFNKLDRDLALAVSGAEAKVTLEDLANQGQLPSLILLDLNLPDISGIDLLKWIKKDNRFNSIPVVILTSSNVDDDIQKSYDLGANTYLVKPISSEALMLALENLI